MRSRHALRTTTVSLALAAALLTAGATGAAATTPGWELSLSGDSAAESLMSVSAPDADHAWAVGRQGMRGVIMRWDGRSWQADTTPGLPAVWQWSAVSAVAADDVWAYGSDGDSQTLVHYDGERWSTVPTTGAFDRTWPEVPLDAVPGRLFKGGDALYTYADGAWQTFELPPRVDIRDIDALSADDAYATGMQYPVKDGHPVVYHWDGTTWTLLPQPPLNQGTDATEIVAEPSGSVYVGGWAAGADAGPPVPAVLRWNGTAWQDVTGPLTSMYLESLSSDGKGGLYATGSDKSDDVRSDPFVWHYDGSTWTKQAAALAPDAETRWPSYAFHDLAPAGNTGTFWAVGDYSTPMDSHGDTEIHALIERSTPES
ncbi:hypothetical protein C3486_01520 [Streptomyces sp. Ru73]|uniref:hypothetical protein n=1 Tax=Streptomyces sp. Ru73 TaxID=2080748 RepID=UPI000CDD7E3B|nr:hypothetical protein [Streptomyces sp. Ru73]POX43251.1 hypothetical protein C3486_01520 [Streptomyces sp. Ru73]